ncbi:MAG: cAMP-activated global transcriptional regulator CRP [Pseudomonadota bacterium]
MKVTPPVEKSEALQAFLRCSHTKQYAAKTDIITPGDIGDTLYYILEGSLSVSMEDPEDGRELVLAYLNKGGFIGEVGVFRGPEKRSVTVRTRTPTRLAGISYSRLHQALKKELNVYAIDILTMFGVELSNRLLETSRKVHHLAFLDVTGRIAGTLMDLCKEPDAMTHPDGMQIRITRQEIGRIVGCSREMAGRVLKELEEKGLLSAQGKTIVVYGTR